MQGFTNRLALICFVGFVAMQTMSCKNTKDIEPAADNAQAAAPAETSATANTAQNTPSTANAPSDQVPAQIDNAADKAADNAAKPASDIPPTGAVAAVPVAPGDTKKATTGSVAAATTAPAAGATATDSAAQQKGQDVSGEAFSVWMQAAKSYEAGKPGTVSVVLTAKSPYKCNDKYPYRFKLQAPTGGVTYPQETVRGMQVSPKRSTMSIPFVAGAAGSSKVSGTLFFSVCTDEKCLMEKRDLSVAINVQ